MIIYSLGYVKIVQASVVTAGNKLFGLSQHDANDTRRRSTGYIHGELVLVLGKFYKTRENCPLNDPLQAIPKHCLPARLEK